MFNKSLCIMPQEYKISILNNKLEKRTVLQRTSRTVQRKCQLPPPEKFILTLDTRDSQKLCLLYQFPLFFWYCQCTRLLGQEEGSAQSSDDGKQGFYSVGCSRVEFLQLLLVKSHCLVFKTCFQT
uniref:Uncharacterized protein n=1 Tax=Molossus molossus TaxID=27622 RepID=A0A7J8HI11_MOLMO|nr:hypothetical protein HJG59_011043 [Molossus molossus]